MAKGFKHGAGGGAPLNFKVVGGTTEPASPKENTIWVNTDVEITGLVFSATEPENPTEGMVWIPTGTNSPVEFNALKKNSIVVYPASAKQYVNGAWVGKRASYYQSGEWKYVRAVIVPNTGVSWTVASGTVTANKTSSATTITHTAKTATAGNAGESAIYTEFDASAYGVLYVKGSYSVNNSSSSNQVYQLQLLTASNSWITDIYVYRSTAGTNSGTQTFEKTIDISAVTGKCRIRSLTTTFTTASTTHTATISSCIVY